MALLWMKEKQGRVLPATQKNYSLSQFAAIQLQDFFLLHSSIFSFAVDCSWTPSSWREQRTSSRNCGKFPRFDCSKFPSCSNDFNMILRHKHVGGFIKAEMQRALEEKAAEVNRTPKQKGQAMNDFT